MKVITKVRVKKWCKKSGGDDRHKKVFDLLSSNTQRVLKIVHR